MERAISDLTTHPTVQGGQNADGNGVDNGRRNYALGVANGALVRLGMAFVHPSLVLSAFVYEQTQSTALVGLLVAFSTAGMMWPQLYISSLVEHLPRKKHVYVLSALFRVTMLAAVVGCMFAAGRTDSPWLLVTFFAVYFVYRSAQGCGHPVFLDLIGQSIASGRLGGFFARRALLGGVLSLFAGFLVVQPIMQAFPAPTSFGVLGLIALVIMGSGWGLFCLTEEAENMRPPRRRSLRQTLAGAGDMLRTESNYRWLLTIRVLNRFNLLCFAFYVPYGVERLGAGALSGVFVGCMAASRLLSSLLWGRLSDRRGNRLCLMLSAGCFCLGPAAALLAPRLPSVFELSLLFVPMPVDLRLLAYLGALCLAGLALEGQVIGLNAFMLESAPADRRPSYVAFLNTVTFPLTFLPALAGLIVGRSTVRLDALFAFVAFSGVLTFAAGRRLTEVREDAGG